MNIDTLHYYFSKYLEFYPLLLPLGLIGVWRWTVWGLKKVVGLYYKPVPVGFRSTVSLVTPVYNEDPVTFTKALNSWAKNKPDEIIAVIDYTDKSSIKIFKEFAKKNNTAHLIITKTPGKRPALADGMKIAKSDFFALVDSDTIWEGKVLVNAMAPFKDKKIGGVTTRQSVEKPESLAQKLFSIRLEQRYWDDVPFLAQAGDVLVCLSGRTSFYRRLAVMPVLHGMTDEKFFGETVISGEDKRLTYLIQAAGWKTTYQSSAKVISTGAKKMSVFVNQQIRWTRNSWRNDLRALYERWPFKYPVFAAYLIDRAIQPFTLLISPIYFVISLALGLWIPVVVILVWWHVSRFVKMSPHLKKYPKDIKILPLFILFNFMTAYIRIFSLLTVNTQGWITRWDKSRLSKLSFLKNNLPHLGTIMIFFLVGVGVFFNKYRNFIVPRQIQRQLVARTLPQSNSFIASVGTPSVLGISTDQNQEWLTKKHVFAAGESLGGIAKQYGITFDNLLNANASKITNWNRIETGLILTIPPANINLLPSYKFNYQRLYDDVLQIFYDASSDQVIISGRGKTITLADIVKVVGKDHLEEVKPGIWDLKTSLFIRSGLTLNLNKSEVSWLRLLSNDKKFTRIYAYNSDIFINGVKITSWDSTRNDYDKNFDNGRSYILVKDNSRMDLTNSEVGYLGYPRSGDQPYSPYGISWRMSTNQRDKFLLTGEILNSKFHNNYFGAYTFGATGMHWAGNEFYDNFRYGLDPHDDSNGFLVENNRFHNNGTHGLIFSKRCVNNVVINNISYDNKLHGIMLHELSNKNLIENNQLYGNHDGVALDHSSNNIVRNNNIYKNMRGVRADKASVDNHIENNTIADSQQYGVYLYSNSNDNSIDNNTLTNNLNAIYIKSANNQASNNSLNKNTNGIYFLGDASQNKIVGNKITYNKQYGIYAKVSAEISNYIEENNLIWRNKKDVMAQEIK